jgi:membrane fusion protein (multidrug efflux system)
LLECETAIRVATSSRNEEVRKEVIPSAVATVEAPSAEDARRVPGDENDRGDGDAGERAKSEQGKAGLLGFPRKHPVLSVIILVVLAAVIVGAILWWLHARQYESTDDAFIAARTVTIAAEVSGRIAEVPVDDNQEVKAGDVLIRIDDTNYQAALKQAEAQVAEANAAIANVLAQTEAQGAKVDAARQQVAEAQAALQFAKDQNKRNQELLKKGAGTEQAAQQSASTLQQDQATLDSAEANAAAAEKQIAVLQAQKESATAQLQAAEAGRKEAEISLSHTMIKAPVDGRATNISAAKGGYAQPGQALMMFVPKEVWVTANFKETQLDLMRPGQPVDIEIDAYPGKTFHGHVDSIQAGSGTAFSLLPAENATGNFVKVVQRVPVKIVFDHPPDVYLGPGFSVTPTVKVR